jgi:hypothetical protein
MSLWFNLRANTQILGRMEIRRLEQLDLAAKDVADAVCTYIVTVDGLTMGLVIHRYGDGAWALLEKAAHQAAGADDA